MCLLKKKLIIFIFICGYIFNVLFNTFLLKVMIVLMQLHKTVQWAQNWKLIST